MRSLAEIVRTARVARGLTTAQFCKATGLSHSTLATIEYGGRPSLMTLAKLATFLKVPADELDPQNAAYKRRAAQPPPDRNNEEILRLCDLLAEVRRQRSKLQATIDEALALVDRLGADASERAGFPPPAETHGPRA
jgi:transcriptional regulator with XRE-family HTH domain